MKNILENSFNDFLNMKGFLDYKISLEYASDYNLLNRLIELGELKEIKLITNNVLSSFQEQLEGVEGINNSGVFEQILKFNKTSRVENFKHPLLNLYRTNYKDYEQVQILNNLYDEVSFVIMLNGLSKTFYVKNKSKIRSDIDVTELIEFTDGEPTVDSLLKTSWNLIQSILGSFDELSNDKIAS